MSTHYGTTRTGTYLHLVTDVTGWYSGMRGTAECGARVNVLEATRTAEWPETALTCRRCAKYVTPPSTTQPRERV